MLRAATHPEVGVEPPPQFGVELLRAVNIGGRNDDDIELRGYFCDACGILARDFLCANAFPLPNEARIAMTNLSDDRIDRHQSMDWTYGNRAALSVLERVTVQSKITTDDTTKPTGHRIYRYKGIGETLQLGTLIHASHPGRALTVSEIGALSDFDDVTIRITDVAARLAVLGDRLSDKLRASAFPQFIAGLNIRNSEIHEAVDVIRVGDAERHRWLIRGRPAPDVQNHPYIRKLKVPRRVAVTQAQNASTEDLFIVASRSLDVGDGEKMRDAHPFSRGHLVGLLFNLYGVH